MRENEIFERITSIMGEGSVVRDVPMKSFTSMKVGGDADFMVSPESTEKLSEIIKFLSANKIPRHIIGNGTNMIFPDAGYRGVIVRLGPRFSAIRVEGNRIIAQAGASLAAIATKALDEGLSGFEFASGIPGTVGGAATMNAGAYGGEMRQVIMEVLCVDDVGNLIGFKENEMDFRYRHSKIQDSGLIVAEVTLTLTNGDREEIRRLMADLNARRRDKQPLNLPSAGSTFKRPEGNFAAKLIEECGLRGCTIGGAQVSEKHCGFIVNLGNATSRDVLDLIEYVRKTVLEKKGVLLEPEVKIIGG